MSTADPAGMMMPGWAAMTFATDALQSCTEACTGVQQEVAHFVDARLERNRRSWEALMATRDIAGVMTVQREWGLQAAADYAQESVRLTRLFTSLSLTGTTPAVQDAARLVA